MAVIGSDEWLSEMVLHLGAISSKAAVSGSISLTVENTPAGKVGWTETIEDGVVVSAESPADKKADIVLLAKFGEYVDMLEGGSDPAVMFMQGRLKLTGDMGMFLQILPSMLTEEAAARRALLAAATDRT